MTLNLRKLLSVSTQLSFEACNIIRQNIQDHSYKQYMKGEDDPVTDVLALLFRPISKYSPWSLRDSKCTFLSSKSSGRRVKTTKAILATPMTSLKLICYLQAPILIENSRYKTLAFGLTRLTVPKAFSMATMKMWLFLSDCPITKSQRQASLGHPINRMGIRKYLNQSLQWAQSWKRKHLTLMVSNGKTR